MVEIEKEINPRYSNYTINPVYHCYFCERAINRKSEEGDKHWPFVKNVANFSRVFKITNLSKEDVVLCSECWDKYWSLIEVQGVEKITKELEKQRIENNNKERKTEEEEEKK